MQFKYQDITEKIIKAYYNVYNTLGFGFLEKVYENALIHEMTKGGLKCRRQVPITVFYDAEVVGNYFADILVEDEIILELKAAESLCEEHDHQLINYLKATNIEVGLLLNFGLKPEFRRKVFSNDRKRFKF
jgi:GxxExxY protein